ncbi:unnamed protein product [Tuber melanosporum]|uniref:(Perigord truffle) hypothetical protein n=1 Tax=Tuber melanosporum (strain Mel28) TaxID=656061 RepID=D5G4T6_TUBMM|nr:uncharacterized protein GSTUM_00000192001 [Tuber melanosporum]KAG0135461.1 hypothetical protein HOY82DRAFT_551550 [Tuber indicum]CAZ79529.1 unnamed protein product [Tuber melanosporum]
MADTDPTFYQRFYHAARIAGPPDLEKGTQRSKSNISLDEDTWLAREKQKRRRSYVLCGVAFSMVLIVGIGIGALVVVVGRGGSGK